MVHPPPPCHVARSVILLVKTILCLCSLGHKPYALCLPICGYKSRAARGICQSSQGSWRVNIIINFMSYFRNVLQPGLCFTSHLPLYLLLVRQHFNFLDVTLVLKKLSKFSTCTHPDVMQFIITITWNAVSWCRFHTCRFFEPKA